MARERLNFGGHHHHSSTRVNLSTQLDLIENSIIPATLFKGISILFKEDKLIS